VVELENIKKKKKKW